MLSRRVIILCGPTASGKSALAVRLARAMHGVVINADSMQVYRDIPILTAIPTLEERRDVPHRLFGYLDSAVACSAGMWAEAARIAIYETWQEGRLPIVVGGTGLYIKTLLEGISPIPLVSDAVRNQVRGMDTAEAYRLLRAQDPDMATKLKPGDTQRIHRAYEVLLETGKSLSYWQQQTPLPPVPDAAFETYALTLDRPLLYARCNARLEQMVENGALAELETLLARNLPDDLPALRAVGVPELACYLRGAWTMEQALEKAQQATRNYAKRQLTWLRHQLPNAHEIAYPYTQLPQNLS